MRRFVRKKGTSQEKDVTKGFQVIGLVYYYLYGGTKMNSQCFRKEELRRGLFSFPTNAYANIRQQVGNYRLKQMHTKKQRDILSF